MLLIFKSGSREGRAVDINRGRVTIGRVAENDVQLTGEKVSRHHAVIEVEDGQRVVLRDLGSRNGTFVDGHRLAGSCVLTGGEQLRFGDEELRVEDAPAARARAEAPPPQQAPSSESDAASGSRAGAVTRRRGAVAALAIAVVVLLVLAIGQLVLPGAAEHRLRSQLARYGTVRQVHVESAPAVKLLWHRADSVVVRMSSYRSSSATLNSNVGRVGDVGRLDASATELHAGLLTVHHATLRKRGNAITASADVTQSDLQTAFPVLDSVRPVSSSGGVLTLQGTATLLGVTSTIDATVRPYRGTLVVSPDVPFGGLATITLFSNPALEVQSVAADPAPGNTTQLSARAANSRCWLTTNMPSPWRTSTRPTARKPAHLSCGFRWARDAGS